MSAIQPIFCVVKVHFTGGPVPNHNHHSQWHNQENVHRKYDIVHLCLFGSSAHLLVRGVVFRK